MLVEEHQLEEQISSLVKQRKNIDSGVVLKRMKLAEAKADFKEVRQKKEKA